MRFVCVFEAVYVCVCAGQSKTGSIVKAFETLLNYDHVYFMFVSQLYPHHEQFKIHEWSMIVFSRETTGAIKRRVENPPSSSSTPPNGDDPIHPDQHCDVPPNDDEMLSGNEPEDPLDDDYQPDYNTGPDPDDDDDGQEYIIPDDYGPPPDDDLDMPGIKLNSWYLGPNW